MITQFFKRFLSLNDVNLALHQSVSGNESYALLFSSTTSPFISCPPFPLPPIDFPQALFDGLCSLMIYSFVHLFLPLYLHWTRIFSQQFSLNCWGQSLVSRLLSLALAGLLVCACHWLWLHRMRNHNDSKDPKIVSIPSSQRLEASWNYDQFLGWITSFFSDDHRTVKVSFLSRHRYYTVDPANAEYILKTNFHNYPNVQGRESDDRLFDLLGIVNTDGSFQFSSNEVRHLSSTMYKRNAMKLVEVLANSNQGVDVQDGKVTLKDDMLPDGTHLKAGDQVAYIPYAMGRMPFLWGSDALEFRPERWIHNGGFQLDSPFMLTPFDKVGQDLVYLQIKIIAALLLRFFQFEMVPNDRVEYRMMNAMTMKHGLRVNFFNR